MIVSASFRTDIPAFYGEWFLRRLEAGFARVVNPYGGPPYKVPLRTEHADGFVFWTKNLGPFRTALKEVRRRGFPFVVQYSINGYPRELEPAVTPPEASTAHLKEVAGEYGPRAGVWRYDTIVFSSLTPPDFHLRNFERLAKAVEGATDEVVISFAQIYRKTRRNMDAAARRAGFAWEDPEDGLKLSLGAQLAACARAHGMTLSVCSQPSFLQPGVDAARCVDARRLEDIGGRPIHARRKGNRPGCGCFESRDIGAYDSCPQGCVYCYAVGGRTLARQRFRSHDPECEFLIP